MLCSLVIKPLNVLRRKFLKMFTLGFLAAILAQCHRGHKRLHRKITLGELAGFQNPVVPLPMLRLAVLRDSRGFRVVSMVCTHQTCLLAVNRELTGFSCPCHNSSFNLSGEVLKGPAKEPLSFYRLELDSNGKLVADLAEKVSSDWHLTL
ncbi:MAG: Rieske (2Fe-2S) protein [Candidatus Dadabacteria bacterium]|nr:MAG: Rieske (2Fe-2S) protein [Candidatus Dadabacteria bacterium]